LRPPTDLPPESTRDSNTRDEEALRVLLVDARASLRRLMLDALGQRLTVSLVGEHYTGEQACREYLRARPDVVLIHLDLPGISGAETAHRLLQRQPRAALVLIGREHEGVRRDRVLQIGVRGYLRETRLRDELAAAVEAVAAGGRYLDTATARELALEGQHPATAALEGLSMREFEIFCLYAAGHSLDAIAARLSLGYKTVAGYGTRIRARLGVRTSAELSGLVARWGLRA
jgi:DNA-binding NarL/FixJ family response regulator